MSGFIRHMSAQISYALVPPDRIVREHDDGAGGFFRGCIEEMDKGSTLDRAWTQAAESCCDVRLLNRDERSRLCELGTQLGVYDAGLQLSALERFAEEFDGFRQTASDEYKEKSRLYTTCSLLAGTLLSILII